MNTLLLVWTNFYSFASVYEINLLLLFKERVEASQYCLNFTYTIIYVISPYELSI